MSAAIARYVLILILLFFASGCAKDSLDPVVRAHLEKPDWISGDSEKYPLSIYLLGRSVSANLNNAKQQSADDLAKNIDQQITASLKLYPATEHAAIHESTDQPPAVTQRAIPAEKTLLDLKTKDYLLKHTQVSEIWQDPATKSYHALSTIDRVSVGDEMLTEVYRLDEQIERIFNKARDEKDVLQRIAFANMAIEKQTLRDKLQAIVKIIKPIASEARTSINVQLIQEQIAGWMSEVKILPIAQHSEFNLLNAMKEGVTSAGLAVHFGAKPDYILKETFSQGQIKWKDGIYSLEGTLNLELQDGEWKGQVRGSANWPIEVSALERNQIPAQLAEAIRIAHQEKLRPTLLSIEE